MMRLIRKLHIEIAYLLVVGCGLIIWIFHNDLSHFFGASSILYALLFAISSEDRIIGMLVLSWIPVFIVGLCISLIYAYKYNNHTPFLVIVAFELIVSAFFITIKIIDQNYVSLGAMRGGGGVRTLLFCGTLIYVTKGICSPKS